MTSLFHSPSQRCQQICQFYLQNSCRIPSLLTTAAMVVQIAIISCLNIFHQLIIIFSGSAFCLLLTYSQDSSWKEPTKCKICHAILLLWIFQWLLISFRSSSQILTKSFNYWNSLLLPNSLF